MHVHSVIFQNSHGWNDTSSSRHLRYTAPNGNYNKKYVTPLGTRSKFKKEMFNLQ